MRREALGGAAILLSLAAMGCSEGSRSSGASRIEGKLVAGVVAGQGPYYLLAGGGTFVDEATGEARPLGAVFTYCEGLSVDRCGGVHNISGFNQTDFPYDALEAFVRRVGRLD